MPVQPVRLTDLRYFVAQLCDAFFKRVLHDHRVAKHPGGHSRKAAFSMIVSTRPLLGQRIAIARSEFHGSLQCDATDWAIYPNRYEALKHGSRPRAKANCSFSLWSSRIAIPRNVGLGSPRPRRAVTEVWVFALETNLCAPPNHKIIPLSSPT